MFGRITPNNINGLKPGHIFVFGSNLGGRHGKGAAKKAMLWGAIYGQGWGLQGQTYAIPTKSANVHLTLSIEEIGHYVSVFIMFAKENPRMTFLVTEIGCGLAGLQPGDVAPLFRDAVPVENIHLPMRFWGELVI